MAVNADLAGTVYPPGEPYEVSRERVSEFATAVGAAHAAHHDPAAARALGFDDVVAPPTFLFVPAFRAMGAAVSDPRLGLDFSRVVHSDQRFRHERPVGAGDSLTCTVTIESVRTVAGNDVVALRADAVAGEALVGTVWTTLLSRAGESA